MSDKATIWQRIDGALGILMGAAMLGAAAWWCWPSGITDMPLAQLTIGGLARAVGSVVLWTLSGVIATSAAG